MSSYKTISQIGFNSVLTPEDSPLTYCVNDGYDSKFLHGGSTGTIVSKYGRHCQGYMAGYCSVQWDGACEFLSQDKSTIHPNQLNDASQDQTCVSFGLTFGEILVRNTATRKYLISADSNCGISYEPFDPTVAASPMVAFMTPGCSGECIPVYAVKADGLDQDPVMNKILNKPLIAITVLVNIYNHAVRNQTIYELKGTRLYSFFTGAPFQSYMHQRKQAIAKQQGT
jgi:hypothetical protein